MKQVLLAIDGDIPSYPVFRYAVGLCKQIRAELSILQFIRDRKLTQCISSTRNGVGRLGKFLEDSFAGIAFAEEGAHSTADEILSGASAALRELIRSSADAVPVHLALTDGETETAISNFVEDHQDIVLTVFDPSGDLHGQDLQSKKIVNRIKKNLSVPLVVVKT